MTNRTLPSKPNDDLVIKVADLLYSLGWRAPGDAQWDHLKGHLFELRDLIDPTPGPVIRTLKSERRQKVSYKRIDTVTRGR